MLCFVSNSRPGGAHQRKGGGEGGHPSAAAEVDLQWQTDVRTPRYPLPVGRSNTVENLEIDSHCSMIY